MLHQRSNNKEINLEIESVKVNWMLKQWITKTHNLIKDTDIFVKNLIKISLLVRLYT